MADRGFVMADIPDRFTWRAVRTLIRYAKPGSAIAEVAAAGQPVWDRKDHRLADIFDLLAYQIWLTKKAKFKQAGRVPKPIPRPGDVSTEKRYGTAQMTTDQVDQWLARVHARAIELHSPSEVVT